MTSLLAHQKKFPELWHYTPLEQKDDVKAYKKYCSDVQKWFEKHRRLVEGVVAEINKIFTELDGKLWAMQTGELDGYIEDAVDDVKKKVLALLADSEENKKQ